MILPVTDPRSNKNDQIKHAVEVLGRSEHRLKVFKAIYKGKRPIKTVSEIANSTGLSNIRVLQEAAKLRGNGIVHAAKLGKENGYRKDEFYSTNRSRILQLVASPEKLKSLPTKTQPKGSKDGVVIIKGLERKPHAKEIYIDDIDSFKAIRKIDPGTLGKTQLSEKKFKLGVKGILGEKGEFTDWGGEKGDLLSSRLQYNGKRITVAFAFKGRPWNTRTVDTGKDGQKWGSNPAALREFGTTVRTSVLG